MRWTSCLLPSPASSAPLTLTATRAATVTSGPISTVSRLATESCSGMIPRDAACGRDRRIPGAGEGDGGLDPVLGRVAVAHGVPELVLDAGGRWQDCREPGG